VAEAGVVERREQLEDKLNCMFLIAPMMMQVIKRHKLCCVRCQIMLSGLLMDNLPELLSRYLGLL